MTTDPLISAARAWEALRRHAGAAEGSDESRRIARDVMAILCGADAGRDSNRDSNRERGHQRTTTDTRARDQVLPHRSPPVSACAQDYL